MYALLPGIDATAAQALERGADALLAIYQRRASVVERIVDDWGAALARSGAHVSERAVTARRLVAIAGVGSNREARALATVPADEKGL